MKRFGREILLAAEEVWEEHIGLLDVWCTAEEIEKPGCLGVSVHRVASLSSPVHLPLAAVSKAEQLPC